MSNATVGTRPERTSTEIAADRKAAGAFFARLDGTRTLQKTRDLSRLIERESFSWNLKCCAWEGHVWAARTVPDGAERARRKAAREAADTLAHRDDSKLRLYVPAVSAASRPEVSVHPRTEWELRSDRNASYTFWAFRIYMDGRRQRILRDGRTPFVQWLLINPGYGPRATNILDDAVDSFVPSYRKYRRGQIRPVNMTGDRALQIAIEALKKR